MLKNTTFSWAKFVIGILLSTVLSLSVHGVMLQKMNFTFPNLSVITTAYKFIIRIFSILGLIFFCEQAQKKVYGSFVKKMDAVF